MVYFDSARMINSINIEKITSESITFNVDGEKLVKEIYEDLKIELNEEDTPYIRLTCQDATFIQIVPNEIFDNETCRQIAIKIMNNLNNEIKTKLGVLE